MSFKYTRAVRGIKGITAPEQHLLFFLADMADDYGYCFPSQQYISEHSFMDIRTVRRALRSLAKLGFIQRIESRSTKHGRRPHTIMLCLDVEEWPKAA